MTPKRKILIVVSSHQEWPEADRKTGYWVGEVSHFAEVVQEAGFEFRRRQPAGWGRTDGPEKRQGHAVAGRRLQGVPAEPGAPAKARANTLRPEEVNPEEYGAIYFAGGHGTMWDFPGNEALARLAGRLYDEAGRSRKRWSRFSADHAVSPVSRGVEMAKARFTLDGDVGEIVIAAS
jgi:hypothetical protein